MAKCALMDDARSGVEKVIRAGDIMPVVCPKPVWLRGGRELSYRVGGGEQVVVAVNTMPTFSFANPVSAIDRGLPSVLANRS